MDEIRAAALNFSRLQRTMYTFTLSKKRKVHSISVDFIDTDFYHIAGLHYLNDIVFDRTRNRTVNHALSGILSDSILSCSVMYLNNPAIEHSGIQVRIRKLIKLEEYLDTNNIIKVFSIRVQDSSSLIDADYVIKSMLPEDEKPVFIFLRKRKESERFSVTSMFEKKTTEYSGEQLFWMKKVKIRDGEETVLYQHKDYYDARDSTLTDP